MTSSTPSVWLITGTSSGFGREMVKILLDRGDKVIATARKTSKIEDLKVLGAHTLELDVTSPLEDLKKTAETAIGVYGKIDYLINNAGYVLQGTIEEATPEQTFQQFNTNVFGLLNVTRSFLPHFRSRKSGCIVLIGSIGGFRGMAGCGLYCTTKFAVEGLGETLREELGPLGIKVVTVEPGYFRTELLAPESNTMKASRTISDYDPIVAGMEKALVEVNGKQPGDPVKGALRIIEIASSTGLAKGREVPVRLPLGSDASGVIRGKAEDLLKQVDEWEEFAKTTDFD